MSTLKARTFQEYNKWHYYLKHINERKLRYLHKVSNLPDAIPAKSPIKYKCNTCNIAKAKKNQNHELLERAKQPLDLVSIDIYS
jgi:beta-lactamase regulating signal transducer with metallopeptidase domain